MRSRDWALIQYDHCPYKKEKFGYREGRTQGEYHVKLKAEIERQRLPANHQKPSERISPVDTLILDF